MRLIHALAACLLAASAVAPADAQTRSAEPRVWRTISRFTGEDEFLRYLSEVRDAARRARMSSFLKQAEPGDCPPELYPCQQDAEDEAIVVTGSRIPSPARAAA